MNKIYSCFIFFALSSFFFNGHCQSQDQNYVKTIELLEPVDINTLNSSYNSIDKIESVTYFDGFGKAKQSVAMKQSPSQKDVIQHIEYDEFGRISKRYLPLPTSQSNGNYILNAQSQINTYYLNTFSDSHPFTENIFDDSPLNRVIEASAPGDTWQIIANSDSGHTTKGVVSTNGIPEVLRFDIDDLNTTSPLIQSYYFPYELIKSISKNENWVASDGKINTTEVFTDKSGKKIAVFSYELINSVETKLQTYYVYDDSGNLRYVLPPKAVESASNTNLTYSNYFDWRPFLLTPIAGGGGVNVNIANGVITINFNAGFVPSKIKMNQPLVYINAGATINVTSFDNYLSFKRDDGSIVTDGLKAEIINNYIYIRNNYGGGYLYQNFNNQTISANVTIAGGSGYVFNNTILSDLCFQYKYDQFNRQIEQKIPGKDWEYMVYDQLDRPILTQDANLKADSEWLFNKFDIFGRVVYSGIYTSNSDRASLQTQVDNFINASTNKANIVSRNSSTLNIGGALINYTNDAFPNSSQQTLTVSYFDDYNFTDADLPTIPTTILGQVVTTRTKGLLTATWTKTLDANTWSKNYTFYDEKGSSIYIYDKNHLGGYTQNESQLDFRGKIKKSVTKHKRLSSSSLLTITDNFEYDHVERPKKHYQKINALSDELISQNTYNELGELIKKDIGGANGATTSLQSIDYTYNIRGWLTNINEVNNMGNDLFAYNLKYDEATEGSLSVPNIYNGNIKQVIWKSAYNNIKKTYGYEYDKLNRFSKSIYRENSCLCTGAYKFETSSLSYDVNGNILGLARTNQSNQQIDNLTYNYDDGNKLLSINDSTNNTFGFNDGFSGNDYNYDANGNLIQDLNKDISLIEYNHLDLVTRITFSNGSKIEFLYDANGAKLQMKYTPSGGTVITTDYFGGFQYLDTQLQFFPTPEGYVNVNSSNYEYVYNLIDHLGNNRVSFSDANSSGTIDPSEILSNTDYYPMGLIHYGELITNSNYNYKFQGKEQLAFSGYNMYDFGSRMYDASVGRWFNTDPQNQFSSPYLAMGDNWISSIDPNGEFVFAPIIAGAFLGLMQGIQSNQVSGKNPYNLGGIFKGIGNGALNGLFGLNAVISSAIDFGSNGYASVDIPITNNFSLSLSPAIASGTNGNSLGLNLSGNLDVGDFSLSASLTGSYYDNAVGTGKSGFGSVFGRGISYDDGKTGFSLYSTSYSDVGGVGKQKVGGIGFRSGDFNFQYENDDGPPFDLFKNKVWAGGTDQLRTTAFRVGIKDYSVGINLFTGYRDYNSPASRPYTDKYGAKFPYGHVTTPGANKYRLGALYFSYKGYRAGINSERVRHSAQNWFAHTLLAPQAGFKNMSWKIKSYIQYQTPNSFSLW